MQKNTVKAAVCRQFGSPLSVEWVELAAPGPGEVRVRLSACAICHSDITYISGAWGGDLPAVYGHEGVGVVESLGTGVSKVHEGERVLVTLLRACGECLFCRSGDEPLCEGEVPLNTNSPLTDPQGSPIAQGLRTAGFAEAVVVSESQIAPIPADIPAPSAALLACGVITGYGAVARVAGVPPGSCVVTLGAGGVGLNCIQAAAIVGALTNIAVDLSPNKLEAAMTFGATHVLNATRPDVVDEIKTLTAGRGADYVFVATGSGAAIAVAPLLVRRGGTVVLVGMAPSGLKVEYEPLDIANDSIRLIGSKMGGARLQTDIPALLAHYRSGRLKLDELVSGCYPLEDINKAIDSVKRGEALRNVIVFSGEGA